MVTIKILRALKTKTLEGLPTQYIIIWPLRERNSIFFYYKKIILVLDDPYESMA